ncbi:hypothetical protein Pint_33944 [Pistacia integerrima]|uniref:Uncharacterized protein n=1 Tax=Pistacia integerrima TaxID=434235 RepID=A0ACC0X324_9ROSI|nr:hypothetical protein Pint_33944 [Pistacia integerrima]
MYRELKNLWLQSEGSWYTCSCSFNVCVHAWFLLIVLLNLIHILNSINPCLFWFLFVYILN